MPGASDFIFGNAPQGVNPLAGNLVAQNLGNALSKLPEEYYQGRMRAPVVDPKTGQPTNDPQLVMQALAERGGLQGVLQSGILPFLYAGQGGAQAAQILSDAAHVAGGEGATPTAQAPRLVGGAADAQAGSPAHLGQAPSGQPLPADSGGGARPTPVGGASGAPAPQGRGGSETEQTATGVRPVAPPSAAPQNLKAMQLRQAAAGIRKRAAGIMETQFNKTAIEGLHRQADSYDAQALELEKADISAREPTGDIKQYNLYADQQRQQGKRTVTFNEWQVQNEADKEAAKGDIKALDELRTSGLEAKQQLGAFDAVRALGKKVSYGAVPVLQQLLGKYGVITPGLGPIQAYQSAIDYLAPRLRPEGSGRLLTGELVSFKDSLGGLMRTPEGREIALNNLQLLAQYKSKIGEIASDKSLSAAERMQKIYSTEPPKLVTEMPGQEKATPQQQQAFARTATNPKTGHKIGQLPDGSWVDAETRKPLK